MIFASGKPHTKIDRVDLNDEVNTAQCSVYGYPKPKITWIVCDNQKCHNLTNMSVSDTVFRIV